MFSFSPSSFFEILSLCSMKFNFVAAFSLPYGTKIQGSIVGKGLYERFHDLIHEGRTYCITNFEVIDNAKDYKATPHCYRLLFSIATHVKEESTELNVDRHHFIPLAEVAGAEEACYPDYFVGRFYFNTLKVKFACIGLLLT